MRPSIEREHRLLHTPVDCGPRVLLLVAAVLLVVALGTSLWDITMFAPQYGDGLRLHIHAGGLLGGNGGQDLKEFNLLNHYIGMHPLTRDSFTEFVWIPIALGALALLLVRAAVFGTVGQLLDTTVLFACFGSFSLWSFGHRLFTYGHELAVDAPVKVAPFMPPLFGRAQMANFEVYSYPGPGSWAILAGGVALAAALVLGLRSAIRHGARVDPAAPARSAAIEA